MIEYDEVVAAVLDTRSLSTQDPVTGKSWDRLPGTPVTAVTFLHSVTYSARLHCMSQSAPTVREAKRLATGRRIADQALELTARHGLEGWTMEDLAEAADVSRRTLFNYFPAKVDAIIGPVPVINPDAAAAFVAGRPHGRLVDDLRELARAILDEEDFDPATVQRRRDVLIANPRLLVTVHERFEQVTGELVDQILTREGPGFTRARARLLVRLLVAVFDACLVEVAEAPSDRSIAEMYDAAVTEARTLLA